MYRRRYVPIREVSSFQRVLRTGEDVSLLERCPQFRGSFLAALH